MYDLVSLFEELSAPEGEGRAFKAVPLVDRPRIRMARNELGQPAVLVKIERPAHPPPPAIELRHLRFIPRQACRVESGQEVHLEDLAVLEHP